MKTRHSWFYAIMIFLSLLLIETSLQIINYIIPNGILADINPCLPDKVLGHRPNPRVFEHDKNGFRNHSIPPQIDIIALGDSQTYGTGVSLKSAWPQQLAQCTGLKVYNMAFGGWGPVHSLLLLPEAMARQPKIIIAAFYAGNDLFDSYSIVYKSENRLDFLKTTDRQTLAKIEVLNHQETIEKKASKADINVAQAVKDKDKLFLVKSFLRDHVKIYKMLSFTKNYLSNISFEDKDKTWDKLKDTVNSYKAQHAVILEKPNIRTILTPAYRFTVVNLDDARISEGLDISLKTFKMMHELCSAKGIQFCVLLIPTKEGMVSILSHEITDTYYLNLVKHEQLLWAKTKNFLQAHDIPYIDSQPYLQDKLLQGRQPYSISDDGHPNDDGHRGIAEGVCKFLQKHALAGIDP